MATNPFAMNNPWAPGLNASRNAYNQTVSNAMNNPLAAWNKTGGNFVGRTGADVWQNPNTAATTTPTNFSSQFNYQNPMYLNDSEGAAMRAGMPFKTNWQNDQFTFNPNDPRHQQWALSADRFGGMWRPTEQADVSAGQGADANTAYRNWWNNYAQQNPNQANNFLASDQRGMLEKRFGSNDPVEAFNKSGQSDFLSFMATNAGNLYGSGADLARNLGIDMATPEGGQMWQQLSNLQPGQRLSMNGGKLSMAQPTQANPYMQQQQQQQPYQVNPYLAQQAAGLATSAITDFQRTIAPGIRSGAMAAGGFGGSRQGIAEGIAVGDLQRNIANATANLFGNAYEGDQNRATNRYTSDNSLRGTVYSADRSLEGTKYSADKSERVAGMQDSTNRYLGQLQAGTTARGQDITRDLGFANVNLNRYLGDQGNATTMRGQDIQRDLGTQRLTLDSRVADQNYGLGLGAQAINQQNANTNRVGVDNSYALGLGNLALGQGQLGVAQQNANTNRISADNAYNLGIGNLALGRDQLGVSQANAGTNAAQAGSQMTLNSITGATNLLNTLYEMGAADVSNPLNKLLVPLINSLMGTSTGQTGTTTTARP